MEKIVKMQHETTARLKVGTVVQESPGMHGGCSHTELPPLSHLPGQNWSELPLHSATQHRGMLQWRTGSFPFV